jgi:hypothetical protein
MQLRLLGRVGASASVKSIAVGGLVLTKVRKMEPVVVDLVMLGLGSARRASIKGLVKAESIIVAILAYL